METFLKFILVLRTFTNFHTALADKLGFVKSKVVYKTRSGMQFLARGGTEDMAEIAVVASGSEYDLDKVDLGEFPVIFDLGAHIGTFSVFASKKLRKSRIFSFEPDSENFELLKQNLSKNRINNVNAYNMAVSNYSGKGYLHTVSLNTDAYYLGSIKENKPNCKVISLVEAAKKSKIGKIDLLKIDIEGGEYELFLDKKILEFMKRNVRYIIMEYHTIGKGKNQLALKKAVKNIFDVTSLKKSVFIMKNQRL